MSKTSFQKQCIVCKTIHTIIVEKEAYAKWRGGELIQNCFPEMSSGMRELMVSGTCELCWEKLFGEEE